MAGEREGEGGLLVIDGSRWTILVIPLSLSSPNDDDDDVERISWAGQTAADRAENVVGSLSLPLVDLQYISEEILCSS